MQPGLFDEAGRSGARPDLAPSAWADGAARQQQSAGVFNAPSESLAVPAPAPASPTAPRKGAIDGGNVGVLASLWHLEEEGERSIVEMLGALPEGVSARMALWLFLGTIVLALCLCGCCCCLALKLASGGFSGGGNLGPGGMEDSDDEDARLKPGADGGSDVVVEADLLGISTQLSPPQPASQVVAPSRKAAAATRTAGATAAVGVCSAAASALAFSLDMPGAVPFDDDKDDPEAELWGLSAGREDDDDDWAAFDEHGK
ncbi:hypothetical protein KFE25_009001 [Diacronema lutheri]|uniref:Transmembrane protein n=1 Tax=Diacronema lutheri TaxID=2081491 RepID=A0A8J5XZ25_DIALT|nr:hypothetical protein KFE25_009001 [Diacronema lutheri]